MPSVSACMSTLNLRFNKMKSNLKELMAKQTYVCSTADVWSHRARSYLGVSIHFIDADWKRHSYILAFKHLKERHILEGDDVSEDEIVAKEMQNEIDRITIHSEQIDFSEAESLDDEINLPKQMRCFAHLLNLIGIYFLSVSSSWTCKIICILY